MASNPTNINADDFISYLAKHGITDVKQRGNEISFACPFGCDDDHRNNEEWHCGLDLEKCVWKCFKCGETGNLITLMKHFGDYEEFDAEQKAKLAPIKAKHKTSLETIMLKAYKNNPEFVKEYFNNRGINDASIEKNKLGFMKYKGHEWFVIPIFNKDNKVPYFKLRRTPTDEHVANAMDKNTSVDKYIIYPSGISTILVGENELENSTASDVLVCEGELDRITAIQNEVKMPVVTGGCGAQTFKNEWIDSLKNMRNIYICMDCDKSGEDGAQKLAKRLAERIPSASIYIISLPFDADSHADLNDYFNQKRGTADELFTKYSQYCAGVKPIDSSQFEELEIEDIAKVLDSTIKYDYVAKCVTFLAMLLAYTESDQLNLMISGDSSSGKSYNVSEVSKLFPEQDRLEYGKTTPTAFYYSEKLRKTDEKGQTYIDLERRIMIFTELPDTKLQENLRALLSHDAKRIPFAITNKGKNGKNVATEGYILGYPSTFFCSADLHIDEQEQTRCLIISPETTVDKVLAGIDMSIDKNSHKDAYNARINSNEARRQLMERILYIKSLHVNSIDINDSEYLKTEFMKNQRALRPKAQREISHFISLVKAMALVNAPFRQVGNKIIATNKDVDEAMKLWSILSESASYGISPQAYDFYKSYVLGAFQTKNKDQTVKSKGVTYDDIRAEFFRRTGSLPNMDNVRHQYIPALKTAALISCNQDEEDGRRLLFVPLVFPDDKLEKQA